MSHRPVTSVLIVDDSAVQRQHMEGLCRAAGIGQIEQAVNGEHALLQLADRVDRPELLIIDLEMPCMDGVELIMQLQRRGIPAPIIVASGRDSALLNSVETMIGAMGLQVLGALRKPVSGDDLAAALARLDRLDRNPAAALPASVPQPSVGAASLVQALDQGLIGVHYQPKADIRTGQLHGVEALARWRHPTLGMIAPDRFIGLAEREGLIHRLTRAVMGQSIAQLAAWARDGLTMSLAINLSPRVLDHAGLVDEICALVEQHGVSPQKIVFEITESSVVDGLGQALGALARLRLKGFGLSIDDYGSGFSSMQQLARMPFTELKIDRSFVHGAHRQRSLRVILQSALAMARQLELVTVAEGIETIEDWRLLQDFGCSLGQGWLLSRAMPGAQLPRWVADHQRRLGLLAVPAGTPAFFPTSPL